MLGALHVVGGECDCTDTFDHDEASKMPGRRKHQANPTRSALITRCRRVQKD
jgi:hypothetical protein